MGPPGVPLQKVIGGLLDEGCRTYLTHSPAVADAILKAVSTWPASYRHVIRGWADTSSSFERSCQSPPDEAKQLETVLPEAPSSPDGEEKVCRGVVSALSGWSGYIKAQDGNSYYFAARSCLPPGEFDDLSPGSPVTFVKGQSAKGVCAVAVRRSFSDT